MALEPFLAKAPADLRLGLHEDAGCAPSTPAWNEPSVLTTSPRASSGAVSSPKYQTLPQRSCAS
jgi:hypothetical protein